MLSIYNLFLPLILLSTRIASLFSEKIRRGLEGRKTLSDEVRKHYSNLPSSNLRILIHAASYGELEQAKPVISAIRKSIPKVHIHLTFFSPSGYENVHGKIDRSEERRVGKE